MVFVDEAAGIVVSEHAKNWHVVARSANVELDRYLDPFLETAGFLDRPLIG